MSCRHSKRSDSRRERVYIDLGLALLQRKRRPFLQSPERGKEQGRAYGLGWAAAAAAWLVLCL